MNAKVICSYGSNDKLYLSANVHAGEQSKWHGTHTHTHYIHVNFGDNNKNYSSENVNRKNAKEENVNTTNNTSVGEMGVSERSRDPSKFHVFEQKSRSHNTFTREENHYQ